MKAKQLSCIISVLMLLFSCGAHKEQNKRIVIGFSLDSLVVERWQKDLENLSRAARDLEMDIIIKIANQNADTQIEQIRELAASGIDVLIVVPNDAKKLTDVIKYVKRKRIPVISYDRLVSNANVDVYISFDNEQVGSLMADTAIRARPKGTYIIVNGAVNDNNAFMIHKGFMEILEPAIARGDITLLGEIWPEEWSSEAIRPKFEALIAQNKKIDVVLCGNDMLAETVIAMLSENRILENTLVLGQDAEISACQRVAEHTQFATIYKPVQLLALKAAGFALMLARKEKIPAEFTISDGTYLVPYSKLTPIVVTSSNLSETVIRDGFHSAEEVYHNISK